MPNANKPDYEVFVSQKGRGEKKYYTKVGAAWNVASDGISIRFISGVALTEGCVLFPPKGDEE